jgi:hypothetical protein
MGSNSPLNVAPQVQNAFRTLDGTAHQSLNERKNFERVVGQILQQRNSSMAAIPSIQEKQIDLFVLFHKVLQEGGFDKVESD